MAGVFGLFVFAWAGSAHAQQRDPTTTHQRLLRAPIADVLFQRSTDEVFGVIGLGICGLGIYAVRDEWKYHTAQAATFTLGFGALELVGLSSFVLPRDDRSHVLKLVGEAWPAVFYAGIAVEGNGEPVMELTSVSLAAGYAGSALLRSIDSFGASTRFSTLESDLRELDTGRLLSSTELASMHRHLLGARGPIARWVRGTPLMVGGAVAMAPMFDSELQYRTRVVSAVFGGVSLLDGLLTAYIEEPVDAYERELERLHVEVAMGAGSFQVRGWFSAL